jgi:hypothetical protein
MIWKGILEGLYQEMTYRKVEDHVQHHNESISTCLSTAQYGGLSPSASALPADVTPLLFVTVRSATITAGVDLLTALFSDKDPAVRFAAIEVYIRRIYRAHNILQLKVRR